MKKFAIISISLGSLLIIGLVVVAILGFVAYRNLYPAKDVSLVPETAAKFRLKKYEFGSLRFNLKTLRFNYLW